MDRVAVTATVTAYTRVQQTITTIEKLLDCRPAPDEVLVHVDGGQQACAEAIRRAFPDIPVIVSGESIGPGGGRNKLMAAACNELVANFDDDSYPYDSDFFGRAVEIFRLFPTASVVGGMIIHRHQTAQPAVRKIAECANFSGCGVVFRRADLIEAGGYIPLPIAYGAEEEDIALRLFDRQKTILFSPWLRVFHDTTLHHHSDPLINAHVIANIGILVFLRYPKRLWVYGMGQVARRVLWCLAAGRWRGILRGLAMLPLQAAKYKRHRAPVSTTAFFAKLRARKMVFREF